MPNNLTYAESERFSPTTEEMMNRLRNEINDWLEQVQPLERIIERFYDVNTGEAFPYEPTSMELEDYEFYLRRRNPSCKSMFPIAIGNMGLRFQAIIAKNMASLGIE